MSTPNRSLVRAGFLLLSFALATGFAIPSFLNPKMALAAHVTGVLNALVLIAVGLVWQLLTVTGGQAKAITSLFLFSTYANWGTSCLAAAWGTSRLTPLSAAGHSAAAWQETVVQTLQVSVALTILTGAILVIHGLRPSTAAAAGPE